MNHLLSKYNNIIRDHTRVINEDCIIRKRGGLLHVCINSPGCRFRRAGSCVMCNYGEGHLVSQNRMKEIVKRIAQESSQMDSILIGTLGSIFDTEEVPREYLGMICDKLEQLPVHTIIFETHYTMINMDVCCWLKDKMPDKDIVIEIGLESADDFVQKECLNKIVNLEELKNKIQLVHSFQMSVTLNVFLGAPFLNTSEQILDTLNTIHWSIENGADSIVIFPANIRKNTLLDFIHKKGLYKQITHWHMLKVLRGVPISYLNRIYFAWYGDWVDQSDSGEIENLPPVSCKHCQEKWKRFYKDFLIMHSTGKRMALIEALDNDRSFCACRHDFEEDMNAGVIRNKKDIVAASHAWLEKDS